MAEPVEANERKHTLLDEKLRMREQSLPLGLNTLIAMDCHGNLVPLICHSDGQSPRISAR